MTMTPTRPATAPAQAPATALAPTARPRTKRSLVAGLVAAAAGFGAATLGHRLVPQIGVLTWAVGLGILAANAGVLPAAGKDGLRRVTKRLLRIGIVLLGFAVPFQAIAGLGFGTIALVAISLVATLVATTWFGRRLGLSGPRSLLMGTGFAICGASAIAAMEDTARADDEDVTAAIAMVTLFGTIAMVVLPLIWGPLGLTGHQYGIWAGASVQEVGQVVAAAGPAGAAVLGTAVVVKLTRVLLLAPVVATVSITQRLRTSAPAGVRPPLVPLFVLGFVACAGIRTTGLVPAAGLHGIAQLQVAALGAALFGMGASVHVGALLRKSGSLVLVGALSTVFIGGVSLAGIVLLGGN
jgi:uncharacterized integral membrane protein (TIGR00698 family)